MNRGGSCFERAVSLIEVTIAAGVATIVLGAALGMTQTSMSASKVIGDSSVGLRREVEVKNALRLDLNRCRLEAIAPDGSSVTYSLPVTAADGSLLDAYGNVIWGVSDSTGPKPGGTITVSFQVDRIRDEAVEEIDLNNDGDTTDRFDQGRLVKTASTGDRLALPLARVVLVRGDYTGDVNGDGQPDPLFSVDADGQVEVRITRPIADRRLRQSMTRMSVAENDLGP